MCDENGRLLERSEPFKLANAGIEFVTGMALEGAGVAGVGERRVVFSFGVNDDQAHLGIADLREVLSLLAPIEQAAPSLDSEAKAPDKVSAAAAWLERTQATRELARGRHAKPGLAPAPVPVQAIAKTNTKRATPFDRILPDSDPKAEPGYRLHLFREPYENTVLAEEQVLPEKVRDPKANRVITTRQIWLKRDDARWLHDQLGELLEAIEQEDSEGME